MTKNLGTPLVLTGVSANNFFDEANLVNKIIDFIANEALSSNSGAGGGATSAGNGFNIGIFGSTTLVANTIRGGNVVTTTVLYLGSNVNANGNVYINGNLAINATTFYVGNSSANTYVDQLNIKIAGVNSNLQINTASISLGNSSVNTFINSTSLSLGSALANATINSVGIFFDGASLQATLPAISSNTTGAGTFVIDSFPLAQYRACEYTITANDLANPNNYQLSKVLVLHNGGGAFTTEYALIVSNSNVGTWSGAVNTSSAILQFTPVSTSCRLTGTKNLILI